MKICVLQPDYATSDVDYQYYDPARDLSHLLPDALFHHVLLNKLSVYKQLKELKKSNYDIFVNLCEGYLEWNVPSIDVIYFMEMLNLPFTGPSSMLYDPPKNLMKYVAYTEGILTPAFALVESIADIERECNHLKYPLFVKPGKAGDSLGVDQQSLVYDKAALLQKSEDIIEEYGPLLVEEYIGGREFTVMLVADADNKKKCTVFKPVEYIFPTGFQFKTYALKTSELHPEANIPCDDQELEAKLKDAAVKIFQGFDGVGYARLDFRVNDKQDIFFLEINFTCSVFYKDGYEGSADYILKADGVGQAGFLQKIISEGIARHKRKQKKYIMKGNSIAGYGIYSTQNIAANELIFKGEELAQRIVTRNYVNGCWEEKEKDIFKKYAYPLSKEVFLLWDNNPANWAPQNHSCNPNTTYEGLNVIALQNIPEGEELTLDYSTFLDENMEPFDCRCGSQNCRGRITGMINNSVTTREISRNG
ncbi:MAG: protein-lysine N-methyltransferase [Ferruginibacter sp.]|uniref:SET domain-containing protein-lysine N-methyltransferase n=1 Tax=Ferruginibacter sp. TaxID=1940288 RepID=UPI00265837F3|nr:SET domain-containing protein-lysine N-methyltransferase [Ferruginibacter sp.]MDB5277615.1 protein-lysine N-methyltransferase [Ferruginibacter sp.]